MIITGADSQVIIDFLFWITIISICFGFLISSFLYSLYIRLLRRIRNPLTLKTEEGLLYRTDAGFYVKKELVEKLNADFKLKNKERWIKHHERQIEFLNK